MAFSLDILEFGRCRTKHELYGLYWAGARYYAIGFMFVICGYGVAISLCILAIRAIDCFFWSCCKKSSLTSLDMLVAGSRHLASTCL